MAKLFSNLSPPPFSLFPFPYVPVREVGLVQNNEYKLGWQCRAKFQITLHGKDKLLLLKIQEFFNGIGSIQSNKNGILDFIVTDLEEISTIIIPHFLNYSLLTQKAADFYCLK
jgi:LAGLIDADG endonuclease